jgi:hypothetical protein
MLIRLRRNLRSDLFNHNDLSEAIRRDARVSTLQIFSSVMCLCHRYPCAARANYVLPNTVVHLPCESDLHNPETPFPRNGSGLILLQG